MSTENTPALPATTGSQCPTWHSIGADCPGCEQCESYETVRAQLTTERTLSADKDAQIRTLTMEVEALSAKVGDAAPLTMTPELRAELVAWSMADEGDSEADEALLAHLRGFVQPATVGSGGLPASTEPADDGPDMTGIDIPAGASTGNAYEQLCAAWHREPCGDTKAAIAAAILALGPIFDTPLEDDIVIMQKANEFLTLATEQGVWAGDITGIIQFAQFFQQRGRASDSTEPSGAGERESFEAWYASTFGPRPSRLGDSDQYHSYAGQPQWHAWQARAALAPVQAQPVAWYDPRNIDPGQSVTFDPAVRARWPHLHPVALVASAAPQPVAIPDGCIDTDVLFALLGKLLGAHQAVGAVAYAPSSDACRSAEKRFAEAYQTMFRVLEAIAAPAPQAGDDGRDAVLEEAAAMQMELALYRDAYGAQAPTEATIDVLDERQRQISGEGWTTERDDKCRDCELARAAATYALCVTPDQIKVCDAPVWPWPMHWWKPTTYRRNIVKAAALLIAEIERLDRSKPATQPADGGGAK